MILNWDDPGQTGWRTCGWIAGYSQDRVHEQEPLSDLHWWQVLTTDLWRCYLEYDDAIDWMFVCPPKSKTEIGTQKNECCSNKYLKMGKWLWKWVIGRSWKNFEVYTRKNPPLPQTVKSDAGENSYKRGNLSLLRDLSSPELHVGRNKEGKSHSNRPQKWGTGRNGN